MRVKDQRIAELERALSFYADPQRYRGPNTQPIPSDPFTPERDFPYLWDVTRDGGKIARDALSCMATKN